MPVLPLILGGSALFGVGFAGGSLFNGDLGKIIKWGVIGGGVYIGAKALKVV